MKPAKRLFRGVRQRHWGKWVAEIRLLQDRSCLWRGTFGTGEEAAAAYDQAAYRLHGDSSRLNFPGLRRSGAHHRSSLHPSVDAKPQVICKNLSTLPAKKAGGSASKRPPVQRPTDAACAAGEENKLESFSLTETEVSSSFPVSEMEQLDFTEAPWDESESFVLRKCPSLEIDWDSIVS